MDPIDLLARERREISDRLKHLATEIPENPEAALRELAHRLHALSSVERHFVFTEARLAHLGSMDGEADFRATERLLAGLKEAPPGGFRFEAIARGLSLLNERRMHELAALRPALAEALGEEGLSALGDEMARALAPIGAPSPLGAG